MTVKRRSQRYRTTALPYRYRPEGLEFELESYSFDGSKPKDVDLDPGQTHIDLSPADEDGAWRRVTIFGRIGLSSDVVEAVFPADERDRPPAKLYVAVQCHETILRDRELVSAGPTPADTYDVSIKLDRDAFRGRVELHPYLVRTETGDRDGPYASKQNVRVAGGQHFTIYVDNPGGNGETTIDGEEVSFSDSPHLPDGKQLYFVDFRNEARPKLWINADHPRITDVLQKSGSVGAEPRLRDVILDQITYGVWAQLIVRAAAAVDDDGEVEYEWQRTVIESFALDMYETNDVEEASLALRREISDPEDLPHVMTRIDIELQEYIDPREQLINLMEEGLQI